ncbi:MAG TPA: hypothetical protein VFV55_07605, partial [Usitatibacteraceae bacterium]|nr:hypothetical protein [Usitatibacteraceae bacterium]
GTLIGTAVVDNLGNYLFDQVLTSTVGVQNPTNSLGNGTGFWCSPPKTMRITSSLSTATASPPIQIK